MNTIKSILYVCILCCFFFPVAWLSYFQDRYRCSVEKNSIDVSLSTGEQQCMRYLSWVQDVLNTTKVKLSNARKNQEVGNDAAYWWQVVTQLESQQDNLLSTQKALIVAMQDFEQELFVRVKRVVWYYLRPRQTDLLDKQTQARKLLSRLLVAWNIEQYAFVRTQMKYVEHELMFLERIKDASDFSTLIPPLQWWMQIQEQWKIKN